MKTKVHVSKLTGKLEGFLAINTNPLTNPFCCAERSSCSICSFCYAKKNLKTFRKGCIEPFESNSRMLSRGLLKFEQFPQIPVGAFVRINAYGEIIDDYHRENIYNIARANPRSMFVLWTKRPEFFQNSSPLKNMILIYSSMNIGEESPLPRYFDKVFTVYREDDAGYKDTSGMKFQSCIGKCKDCMACYTKNAVIHVHERLKGVKV